MEQICDSKFCTGCAACFNICRVNAISMIPDAKGFLHPKINQKGCINCGCCVNVCPQVRRSAPTKTGQCYAAVAVKDAVRDSSSSGGIFYLLAEKIIKRGGVVSGAAWQGDFGVKHIVVKTIQELPRLQGSKYVQSEIGDSFKEVQSLLLEGTPVLFSGTPCQIAGLQGYLGKEYRHLLTVDLLCHGVPSTLVLHKFLDSKSQYGRVKRVNFREKKPGWESFSTQLCYEDGTKEIDNSYFNFFVDNYCLRESCSHCIYASPHRLGDITLGDFWGYQESAPEHIENDDRGISLVSINSLEAERFFKSLGRHVSLAKRDIETAASGNAILRGPFKPNSLSNEFWADLCDLDWDQLVKKYKVSCAPKKDWISQEDRDYYAKPYKKRHFIHKIRCIKRAVVQKFRNRKR